MSGSNPWGQATEFGVSEGTRELFEGVSRGGAGSTLGICREKGVGETEAWEEAGSASPHFPTPQALLAVMAHLPGSLYC